MQRRWHYALFASLVVLVYISYQEEQCICTESCVDELCSCSNSSGTFQINCTICETRTRLTSLEGVIQSHDLNIDAGYSNLSTCSILIQSPENTIIRLYLDLFKTECSWDFLHIHDGISPFDPTIAVYGGNLVDENLSLLKQDREITSTNNSIYLVFRPDEFVNHDGFKIAYKVDGCPNWCSKHGDCVKGKCECEEGWEGDWCNVETCNCVNGGTCQLNVCQCPDGFGGVNCEQNLSKNSWEYIPSSDSSPGGRANFAGSLINDEYWIFGGFHFFAGMPDAGMASEKTLTMAKYNVTSRKWTKIAPSGPVTRSGHTLTAYNNDLYMYGGQVDYKTTDELWKFDGIQWHQLNPQGRRLSSMGHCSVILNSTIYFIGGIDDAGVVIIDVQMYEIKLNRWTIVSHRNMTCAFYHADSKRYQFDDSRIMHGRFAPSCVHNPVNGRITVFGGLNTTRIMSDNSFWYQGERETIRESTFIEYDVDLHHWSNLYVADINSVPMLYLSTIQVVGRSLLVFGGRYVNIGLNIGQSHCFALQPYILNIETGEGRAVGSFSALREVGPVRMGLGSFVYKNSVYLVGGYNGQLHDDVIVYHIVSCGSLRNKTLCEQDREDFTTCLWDSNTSTCSTKPISACGGLKCTRCVPGDGFDKRCIGCTDDPSCLWDQHYPDTCRARDTVNITTNVAEYNCRDVPKPSRIRCSEYKLCEHCKEDCYWNVNGLARCSVNIEHQQSEVMCQDIRKPCNQLKSCGKCVSSGSCMWCQLNTLNKDGGRPGQCLDTTTYYALFPFGQCVHWHMGNTPYSQCPKKSCIEYGNCTLCQQQPECGWCDDETGTGSGYCLPGTYNGTLTSAGDASYTVEEKTCRAHSWYYDTCPLCQCNGHSVCSDKVNCDSCNNHTTGKHCDKCKNRYYGDATNKGVCKLCDCPRHSDRPCNIYTGDCACNTKGITGSKCDRCLNHDYRGDPVRDTCYFVLAVGYTHVPAPLQGSTKANFVLDLDEKITSDIEVTVTALQASYNIVLVAIGDNFDNYTHNYEVGKIQPWNIDLKKSRFKWDRKDVEIRLFVTFHKADPKIEMGIIVRKHVDQIDLKQFFIIFFACVVILLLIFLLVWTAKIRYSQYRNQIHQEMQLIERAARPFKTHRTLFKDDNQSVSGSIFEIRPLAIETLKEEKYAIVSYLLSLPGPKEINLTIGSGSFVTALPYHKITSHPPSINFEGFDV